MLVRSAGTRNFCKRPRFEFIGAAAFGKQSNPEIRLDQPLLRGEAVDGYDLRLVQAGGGKGPAEELNK